MISKKKINLSLKSVKYPSVEVLREMNIISGTKKEIQDYIEQQNKENKLKNFITIQK